MNDNDKCAITEAIGFIKGFAGEFKDGIRRTDGALVFTTNNYTSALEEIDNVTTALSALVRTNQMESANEVPALLERLGGSFTTLVMQLEQDAESSCNHDETHNARVGVEKHDFDNILSGVAIHMSVLRQVYEPMRTRGTRGFEKK